MSSDRKKLVFFLIMNVIIFLILGCRKELPPILCDHDRVEIHPIYAVYFSLKDSSEKRYCSIVCATLSFSKLKDRIRNVIVTDEVSGSKIDATQAFFVESEVITTLHVKNRIHMFSNREDAKKHLKRFNGRWIENPFH